MRRRRPELIIPIRDRRRHVRILTLKNFGKALLVVAVLLVTANVVSEIRPMHNGEYGELFGHEVAQPAVTAKQPEVVAEAPVQDAETADPLLVAPTAREQYLATDTATAAPAAVVPDHDAFAPRQPLLASGHGHVAIVGDGSGVSVVSGGAAAQRTLTGGIFR